MKQTHTCIAVVLSFLLLSCEKNNLGTVNVQTDVPILTNPIVTPDSVYIDSQVPTGDQYSVSTVVRVKMSSPGTTQAVTAKVLRPTTTESVAEIALKDDGTSPDQTANDSVYSGQVQFAITRPQAGRYRVQFVGRTSDGGQSNVLERTLILSRANSIPSLSNAGIRPNTPTGASSDSTRVLLTVAASDSDGISDILQVSVVPRNTIDSSGRILVDNGDPTRGDQVAGDGVYSALVWVKPTTTLQNIEFVFSASDNRNAQSNEVRRLYMNHVPIIVNLNVPSTIQRPSSGSRLVPFYQTVADSDGLGDIDSVYFRNVSSANPVNILMYDDGDATAHGDSVANNGVYSRLVTIDPTTSLGPKEFHFYVLDRFGARDSLITTITIN